MTKQYHFNLADQICILPKNAKRVMIFFHGLGATNDDLVPVYKHLTQDTIALDDMGAIFVQSPIQPCKLFGGESLPCWFDVDSLEDVLANKWLGLKEVIQALVKFIDDVKTLYPHIESISFTGFSQGGIVAQKLAEQVECENLVLLSTFAAHSLSDIKVKRCFVGHGILDQVVNIMYGRQLHQRMMALSKKLSFEMQYHEYTFMDHSICPEEMNDMRDFIA